MIRQVYLIETSNSVVSRRLGESEKKMNEAVVINNRYTMDGGGKRLVRPFKRKDFWKYIS